MKAVVPVALAAVVSATVALAPVAYKSRESVKYRNFRVVKPGVLYRSGQMTPDGFDRVFREFGIRTVISLRDTRDDGREPDDADEQAVCERYGIRRLRFPKADWGPDRAGHVSGEKNVEEFLNVLADPTTRFPILVHCFAGIHRTGPYCAVYRMEYEGWTAEQAIEEMKEMGTVRTTFADNLLDYLSSYPDRMANRRAAPLVGGSAGQR